GGGIALVQVDRLAFVVVDWVIAAEIARAGLRGLVRLEAKVKLFFRRASGGVIQPAIAEHQIVVSGNVLRINRDSLFEPLHGRSVVTLEKKDPADLIKIHAISRILPGNDLQFLE